MRGQGKPSRIFGERKPLKLNVHSFLFITIVALPERPVDLLPILASEERKEESNGAHWDYEHKGPDKWRNMFGNCADEQQSPIDIREENLKCDSDILKPLQFNDYDKDIDFKFIHNGHTIIAYPLYDQFPQELDGAGLPLHLGPFELTQFHFHWGSDYYEGSEHQINGRNYPLEIHLVHTSSKNDKFIAVLGVLFELSEHNNPLISPLLDPFSYLSLKEQNVSTHEEIEENSIRKRKAMIKTLNLLGILSIKSSNYFYYDGSLTTPPCTQGVKWIILNSTIGISKPQLDIFHSNVVKKNNRNVQQLNRRFIYTNNELVCSNIDYDVDAANSLKTTINIYSVVLISLLFSFNKPVI